MYDTDHLEAATGNSTEITHLQEVNEAMSWALAANTAFGEVGMELHFVPDHSIQVTNEGDIPQDTATSPSPGVEALYPLSKYNVHIALQYPSTVAAAYSRPGDDIELARATFLQRSDDETSPVVYPSAQLIVMSSGTVLATRVYQPYDQPARASYSELSAQAVLDMISVLEFKRIKPSSTPASGTLMSNQLGVTWDLFTQQS